MALVPYALTRPFLFGLDPEAAHDLTLATLAPLLELHDVAWFSLQQGDAARQIDDVASGSRLVPLDAAISLARTAALITELDLIISVDTSIAHLAGAMARPCWVMLPFAPDWRWMLNRSDSPWYPTLRLFRQPRPRDWSPVVSAMVEDTELYHFMVPFPPLVAEMLAAFPLQMVAPVGTGAGAAGKTVTTLNIAAGDNPDVAGNLKQPFVGIMYVRNGSLFYATR